MKSKQSLFKEILDVSIKKVREKSIAGAKDQFEQRMKTIPSKISQLNADPYMFIFDALIQFPEQVDFTLTQYHTMLKQNFLNMEKNSNMLVRHFRKYLQQHNFRIIQIMMDIRQPNLQFIELFFEIHNSIQMAENVLQGFRYAGYRWMVRAFCFHKPTKASSLADELATGILKPENRNLPTAEDDNHSYQQYIKKMLSQMTTSIENNLKPEGQRIQSKYGFCFMCLNPANYYCKDTKISVCSSDCKKAHMAYIFNNHSLDFQYSQKFRSEIEKLLVSNLKRKKNMALTIDYLCSIYMNSDYYPMQPLPHRQIITSAVIVERVWILYIMYNIRRGEVFEHIFADCLTNKNSYVFISASNYFLKLIENQRFYQVYQFLDFYGYKRIVPIILANLQDEQNKIKFIYSLIDKAYASQDFKNLRKYANQMKEQSALISTLLRAINYDKNPIQKFKQYYGQAESVLQMVKFVIKNQQQINKNKFCEFILQNKEMTQKFVQQLLIQNKKVQKIQNLNGSSQYLYLKFSPFLDQIVRQVFYFLNPKTSQKIYELLSILYDVLDFKKLRSNPQVNWNQSQLHIVFSSENITSPDTLFQLSYLIIIIVSQISNKKGQKPTQAQFLKRVKDIDPKFVTSQKQYLIAMFNRLNDFPMSQQSRGILCSYRTVKKIANQNRYFHPYIMILDNWEQIYQVFSNINNDIDHLYRVCKCLIHFPDICQPFFQLLLSKIATLNNTTSLIQVSVNAIRQQNLLTYINNILHEEPNCVGITSWKYLFLRDPEATEQSKSFIFDLKSLIHYSKSLRYRNFIWFARQFCRNVNISQSLFQCLDLLQFNMMAIHSDKQNVKGQQRIQVLNSQMIQPHFFNSKHSYYQIQFLKGVFEVGDLELGVRLLDFLPVNTVTQKLIIFGLTEIVQKSWKAIQQYGKKEIEKQKQKIRIKQKNSVQVSQMQKLTQIKAKQSQKSQKQIIIDMENQEDSSLLIPPIWQHILTKAKTVCLLNTQLLQPFSKVLKDNQQLINYYQVLNIEYSIQCAFNGKHYSVDPTLRKKLSKFQHHIPQMYNSKFSTPVRINGQIQQYDEQKQGILQQFVNKQNLPQIIKHWKYFWEIQQVYEIIVSVIKSQIWQMCNINPKETQKIVQINKKYPKLSEYVRLLKILAQNEYLNIIKLQNRLQSAIGFVVAANILLQMQGSNQFVAQVDRTVQDLVIGKALLLNNICQLQSAYSQFQNVCCVCGHYVETIYSIIVYKSSQNRIGPLYQLQNILKIIEQFNNNFQLREKLSKQMPVLGQIDNSGNTQQVQQQKQVPHLLDLQSQLRILLCLYFIPESSKQVFICNWNVLHQLLLSKLAIFKQMLDIHSSIKKSIGPKDSEAKIKKNTPRYQYCNQQIHFLKKVVQKMVPIIQERSGLSESDRSILSDISEILVQYMNHGFDFYDTESYMLQFHENKSKNVSHQKLAYKLYQIVRAVNKSKKENG